jgi:hypothetical protein
MDFEKRVDQYVRLRDIIKAKEEDHKKQLAPMKDMLQQLNNLLLGMLQQTKQDSANTAFGTVYRKTKKSATIADAALFRRHVIGGEHYDLIDWRANVTAVAEWIDENHEPPPGVNYSTSVDVGVRRGKE